MKKVLENPKARLCFNEKEGSQIAYLGKNPDQLLRKLNRIHKFLISVSPLQVLISVSSLEEKRIKG